MRVFYYIFRQLSFVGHVNIFLCNKKYVLAALVILLAITNASPSLAGIHIYDTCGFGYIPRCEDDELQEYLDKCASKKPGRYGCHSVLLTSWPSYYVLFYSSVHEVPPEHRTEEDDEILLSEDTQLGPDNNNGASCNNTSNPINIATGNKFYSDVADHFAIVV